MDNGRLLNHGDDNGDIGAVATEWPDIKLTRADLGERLGTLLADNSSPFVPKLHQCSVSSRGKLLRSSSALLANAAVLVCTCRPSSTLAAVLRRSDAVGLVECVPCCAQQHDRPVGARTSTSFDFEEHAM